MTRNRERTLENDPGLVVDEIICVVSKNGSVPDKRNLPISVRLRIAPLYAEMLVTFPAQVFPEYKLVNQILSVHVRQMRSFLVIREVFANAVDHHHYESAVIYVQPVTAADEFIIAVSYERTVNILAQVWLVKSCHDVCS